MKILKDLRIVIGGGFIALLIAIIDLSIQGGKYDYDLQSLQYLSAIGWVFFIIFGLCFVWTIVSFIIEVFRQIIK